jgi:hypothetical protein
MITDSINQARGMGASSDDILNEVYKQNPNLQHSIDSARGLNADSDTILNEITKQNTIQQPEKPGLFGTIKNIFSSRAESAGQIADNTDVSGRNDTLNPFVSKGKNSLLSGAIQETGNAIGAGGEIAGAVATPVVKTLLQTDVNLAKGAYNLFAPGYIKDLVSKVGEKAAQMDIVPKLQALGVKTASDWQDFSKKHPVLSGNISGLVNIASILPIGKAVDLGVDALKTGSTAAKDLAKSLLPDAEKQATKALSLNPSELKEVNTKRLNWLSEDSLSSGETKQGLFTPKTYTMPKQVKQLATEFKDVLVGTPEKVIQNATELGKGFRQKVLSLFTGSEKAINRDTFLNKVKSAIANDSETIYSTVKEQQQVASKAVANLSKHITTGTNKGIEEGLAKWYSESKNASGLLSNANKVIQKVVKDTVKSTLPAEKAALYDTYKTKMAKLYDVQEIMKAKVKASIGKSTVQNIANKLKVPAGVIGAWEGGKRLLTGQW